MAALFYFCSHNYVSKYTIFSKVAWSSDYNKNEYIFSTVKLPLKRWLETNQQWLENEIMLSSKSGSKFLFINYYFLIMERKQHTVPAFKNAFEIKLLNLIKIKQQTRSKHIFFSSESLEFQFNASYFLDMK